MNETEVNTKEPDTQPEDNGAKAEKKFTQEEVNKIVQDRLAKERSRNEQSKTKQDDPKIIELNARENKLICREFLMDNGFPSQMLECLDTSDPEKFKSNAISLFNSILATQQRPIKPVPMTTEDNAPMGYPPVIIGRGSGVATPSAHPRENLSSPLDAAFSSSAKHKPRKNY